MTTAVSKSQRKQHGMPHLGGLRFRSILVATDCTSSSTTAVKLAARFAKEFDAKLCVLHSVMPEIYNVTRGPFAGLEQLNLENAPERLHKYDQHIPALRTVKHEEIILLGSPNAAIHSAIEANGIDLLVVGSHGRRGLAKMALGSVAEWAIRHLNCPVLVAGPNCNATWRPIRSIVLATALSQDRSYSADYASSLAQDYNAKLTLLHVRPAVSPTEAQSVAERNISEKLRQLLPTGVEEGCTLKFEVKTGDVATEVLHSAKANKASIVVLSAHHNPFLADRAPRTTISTIIGKAPCPVLVIPGIDASSRVSSEKPARAKSPHSQKTELDLKDM
jgi:nucleotide-binding universal stress UspA family protein